MSDPHSAHTSHAGHAAQSSTGQDMKLGKIIVVGALSLSLFAGGIAWSYYLMTSRQEEINAAGAATAPTKLGQDEIGIVDQVLFETDHRLDIWKAQNARKLTTYGWVDRAKGIVRIPIEVAMQQVIASPPDSPGQGVPPVTRIPAVVKAGSAPGSSAGVAPHRPKPGGTP